MPVLLPRLALALTLPLLAAACKSPPPDATSRGNAPAASAALGASASPPAATPAAAEPAMVGKPAPDFKLPSVQGPEVQLSEHRGKIVVLEWFNPDCPFVQASHTKASLKGLASRHAKDGVVWLAINSAASGKQGHGVERNQRAMKELGMTHPVLLDESGAVGRLYGAERTPHMYVIDEQGVLVYAGAIDNSPDGEGQSPQDGALVNYVDRAIQAVRDKKPVAVPKSKAYGCSVKYRS